MKPGNQLFIPKLNQDWEEIDKMMLFACFTLLERFTKEEMPLTNWNTSLQQQKINNEIDFLLEWWNKRKYSHKECDEKEQQQEDTLMLIRLIQIRNYLWS